MQSLNFGDDMSAFRFKQFSIDQTGCVMKINTDGVLLGAMATADKPLHILDVGTGTGVIALMLAQRFPMSIIDAIEIDSQTAETARINFNSSPFADRLSCYAVGLNDFKPDCRYDLIISNPPYFLDALRNPDSRKSTARHTDWNFFDLLLGCAGDWLSDRGSLQLVLPVPLMDKLRQKAVAEFGFAIQWEVGIHSFEGDRAIRNIVAMGKEMGTEEKRGFVIYEDKGQYSKAYKALLKDFFLAF